MANARPLITGVADVNSSDPDALRHVKATGASFVHIALSWAETAPAKEPESWYPDDPSDIHYDWSVTDHRVTAAVEAGLTPVLLVDGGPAWAQRCQAPAHAAIRLCDPKIEALAAFATAASRRYSGQFGGLPRVRYWQGLNEPNLSLFFNPQFESGKPVSPDLYRHLINAFSSAVKAVDASNLVLASGLGPIARPRSTVGPMRFARDLLCMRGRKNPKPIPGTCDGGVHVDILDIHPYTTGGPTHHGKVDDVQFGDLAKLQELIVAADRAGRIKGRFPHTPLWITEMSWDSEPPDPGGVPMRILTRWTAEALYRAWDAGVSHFFWYSLRDQARDPDTPFSETLESGLYFRGATFGLDKPKDNMYAFRFPFVAYSKNGGFSFWGRTPTSKGGPVLIQIKTGSKWRNAGLASADRNGIFEGNVEGGYGRNRHGTVRARWRKELTIPFSLQPVRDFYQPPFGAPQGEG